jgi:hypothetical protein
MMPDDNQRPVKNFIAGAEPDYSPMTLQGLLDREAIRDLVLSYSRGVDRHDFAFLRTLYTADAIEDDHGGNFSGTADAYVDWLEEVMGRVRASQHQVFNHTIMLEGAYRAQGEVYLAGRTRLAQEDGSEEDLTHGLRYLDHYRKVGTKWLFARRTIIVDWLEAAPTQWAPERDDTRNAQFGTTGADDPSYRILSHPYFRRR